MHWLKHHISINLIVGVFILVPSTLWAAATSYWFYDRMYGLHSVILHPKANADKYHVGDVMEMTYSVIRYATCELRLSRIFRRPDDREVLLMYVIQSITADNPPHEREQGYQVEVPQSVLAIGEKKVTGEVFTRIQYFCNALDYMAPRSVDMPEVEVTVYAKGEPIP